MRFWGFAAELVRYQWLLQELVIRDLKLKYRRSVLGYLWSVLNPLMMMAVLTVVFSNMFRFDIPNYPLYLLSGQLIYGFYAESTSMAMDSILSGGPLLKKVYLPKYIFPLSRVLSCFTTLLFSMAAFVVVSLATGNEFHATALLVPLLFAEVLLFCVGTGLLLSVWVVFFRDVRHLYGVFLTALNFLTPIFYPVGLLPDWLQTGLLFNPLYHFVTMFRKLAVYGVWPTAAEHAACLAFSLGLLFVGRRVFRKNQNEFILYV